MRDFFGRRHNGEDTMEDEVKDSDDESSGSEDDWDQSDEERADLKEHIDRLV
jgi:hypothetical protein